MSRMQHVWVDAVVYAQEENIRIQLGNLAAEIVPFELLEVKLAISKTEQTRF